MHKGCLNKKGYVVIGLLLVIIALALSISVLTEHVMAYTFVALSGVISIMFALFEAKYVMTEKIVLIAILSSIAAIGRTFFAGIASVQPASFVIMVTGVVFGPEIGFITGAITALSSNLVLGQGPWTVWQMFTWGMMGFLSGVFNTVLKKHFYLFLTYGFVWGFVFGWIMNGWFLVSGYVEHINKKTILAAYVASFPMDLAHAVCNVCFLALFAKKFIQIFARIAKKYGLY